MTNVITRMITLEIACQNHCSVLAPSAYATEKVNLAFQPAYSFGSRPEEKVRADMPGKHSIICIYHLFNWAEWTLRCL